MLLPFGRRLGDDDALPPLADPVKPLLGALPVMAGMVVSQSLSVRWLLRPIMNYRNCQPCSPPYPVNNKYEVMKYYVVAVRTGR